MTTFSQMVDSMVLELRRPDLRTEMTRYLNQSLRECFFHPENNRVVLLRSAYQEARLVVDSDLAFSWVSPNPSNWAALGAARYDSVWRDNRPVYAKMLNPGARFEEEPYVVQNLGAGRLVFKGHGGVGATISLSYYEFTRAHKYYPVETRPAQFDLDLGWSYLPEWDTDDSSRLLARLMVTNWLLMGWPSVLEEGLRAKIYKRLSEDTRQRTSYALWMQQRMGIISTEEAELMGTA